jgi:hypothetical protein
VHFREILSGYFLFSRFDWSIFVTQLVARHMKEIIIREKKFKAFILFIFELPSSTTQEKIKVKLFVYPILLWKRAVVKP